jgi:hypothetical protein
MQAITTGVNFGNRFLDIVVIEDGDLRKPDVEDETLLQLPLRCSLLAHTWFGKHPCNLDVYISVDHFATCFHDRFHSKRKKKP